MPKKRIICKILLIFADDGVADSQNAIDISKTMQNEVSVKDILSTLEKIQVYQGILMSVELKIKGQR